MSRPSRPGAGPRREYWFPSVVRHTLSNGLRVIVAPISRLPVVSVVASVDAGATHDAALVEGLAALTARMLGEGTVRLEGADLTEQFESLGSGLDVGSGWDESEASLTVTPERLGTAVPLLGEVLAAPRFSERDVARLGAERLAELQQQLVEPRGLFIEREMTACTDIKKPTAYFLLDRMAKQGWITMRETREGNRPPRRVYRLTAKGEAEYQKLLRENLGSFIAAKFPGDVGLAYAEDLDPQEVLTLLAERRTALVAQLEETRQVPQHADSLQLLVDHQLLHLEAELAWLDQVMAKFKKKAKQG